MNLKFNSLLTQTSEWRSVGSLFGKITMVVAFERGKQAYKIDTHLVRKRGKIIVEDFARLSHSELPFKGTCMPTFYF